MKKLLIVSVIFLIETQVLAMTQNPIISRGKPVYSSGGNASYLADNKFGGSSFTVSNGSWIAINVGTTGHPKAFVSWNNPNYTWSDVIASANSCKQNVTCMVNYTIQTSSNSTNGNNGTWATVVSVSGNNVTARGHLIDFSGASWVRINITSGAGSIDEVEVFDISDESSDLWFFPGTSITANTYKASPPAKDYADLINQTFPGFNPIMIRGGIPCINSGNMATDISKYLAIAGNVKYWAIEMGTNDAWGGGNGNVTSFKKNMQLVIDSCKAAGIEPIIARMIGTNKTAATWQVHPDFLAAIDSLTVQNSLIAGPDLYTWFTTHTSELNSDGVHPNATGAASIQRLWAEKMASLYPAITPTVTGINTEQVTSDNVSIFPNPATENGFNVSFANIEIGSILQIYDLQGKLVFSKPFIDNNTRLNPELVPGIYMVKIKSENNKVLLNQRLVIL